jgi:hypothetical protein
MSKIVLSGSEFRLLADHFQAPKQGAHVRWKEFGDCVDEVFTIKNLERSVDIGVGDARTQSFYGKADPTAEDEARVAAFQEQFKSLVQRERLDAKSFFQDQDRHNYFKVSPKQFLQTATLLGVQMSDAELRAIVNVYGTKLGDIEYLPFLKDTFVLRYVINDPYTGARSTYRNINIDFTGANSIDGLMKKIKDQVMRDRIRVGEFL